jgi:hypothetical protein
MIARGAASALWCIAALALMALTPACRGGGGEEFPRVVTLGEGEVFANITNSSLTSGLNRVSIRLMDVNDEPVLGADVSLRFFDVNDDDPEMLFETDAAFVLAELGYVDEQSGGAREVTGTDGVYVATVTFERPGNYGVMVEVAREGEEPDDVPFRFNVLDRSSEPMLGDAAPRSVQPTIQTSQLDDIDSSSPKRAHMHDTTIADAIASGRPAVIAFATPAFCRSRTCAPVMDSVMDPLYDRYGEQATFIHVEPFSLADLRSGFVQTPLAVTREWGLQSEPWIFVVGSDGRVAAKFEGIAGLGEVEAALKAALRG